MKTCLHRRWYCGVVVGMLRNLLHCLLPVQARLDDLLYEGMVADITVKEREAEAMQVSGWG